MLTRPRVGVEHRKEISMEMFNKEWCHWMPEEIKSLQRANCLADVAPIAVAIAKRMGDLGKVIFICGPITGNELENRKKLYGAIEHSRKRGFMVFDQEPLESLTSRVAIGLSSVKIVDQLYAPLLRSGRIAEMWKLQGSDESKGARREMKLFSDKFPDRPIRPFSDDLFKANPSPRHAALLAAVRASESDSDVIAATQ